MIQENRYGKIPVILKVLILPWILIALLGLTTMGPDEEYPENYELIDEEATDKTQALYQSLNEIRGEHCMFGHQATLAYGYRWKGDSSRSDVKDVTGSFPAVYGWDIADFLREGKSREKIEQDMQQSLAYARQGLSRGGVLTFAWHMSNPVTGQSFYDTTRAVHTIIPGGKNHEKYKKTLDTVAEFFKKLSPYPVIFRPYHEHNGDWFWWGKAFVSEENFKKLWRFTVEYLRDQKEVHNLIWAFSPDRSRTDIESFKEDYFYGYPGDQYVDIIGLDNYWDVGHDANDTPPDVQQKHFIRSLTMTAELARERGKIAALTETGLEAIPDADFWTDKLLAALTANDMTREITHLLVWRNANKEIENREHFYAPYPGQKSADDFIQFYQSDFILFEDELPDMYE